MRNLKFLSWEFLGEDAAKHNAFDFLRLAAALAVLFSHSFALYGLPEPVPIPGEATIGGLSVYVFFAISGFLICQSWDRDSNLRRFIARRALRILPGLAVAVCFTAVVLGPLMSGLPVVEYFSRSEVWTYIANNVSVICGKQTLPGVFTSNPAPKVVNGSLWTIRYEVMMYALLAGVGLSARRLRSGCLALLIALAAFWCTCKAANWTPQSSYWRWELNINWRLAATWGVVFFAGSCLYLYRSRVPRSVPLALSLCALCAVPVPVWPTALVWITVPYCVFVAAYGLPEWFRRIGKTNDLSYGIYIYAFPVQQTAVAVLMPRGYGWAAVLCASLVATVALAWLSWRLVESTALQWKSRLGRSGFRALAVPADGA